MTASTRTACGRLAPPPPPHVSIEPGALIGRYRVGEEIGRGSYAVVYNAQDLWVGREVALKVVAAANSQDMLLHEAQLLCRVQHRHVVTFHDIVRQGDIDVLVLELVAGRSLNLLVRQGPLPAQEVASLGMHLAEGLGALHAEGILHRDIKPANLRLSADGVLKILDLGVGCRLISDGSGESCATAPVVGTIPYMSPERLQGGCGDARSDLWSAAAVLFELATGRRVVDGLSRTARERFVHQGRFPDPRLITLPVQYPLGDVIARSLAPDPRHRHQSAHELLADLAPIAVNANAAPPVHPALCA